MKDNNKASIAEEVLNTLSEVGDRTGTITVRVRKEDWEYWKIAMKDMKMCAAALARQAFVYVGAIPNEVLKASPLPSITLAKNIPDELDGSKTVNLSKLKETYVREFMKEKDVSTRDMCMKYFEDKGYVTQN